MRGRADLDFPGAAAAAAAVVIVFLPLIALLARRRWRLSAARGEEVRRLLRLAAEEEARAEAEAAMVYVSVSSSEPMVGSGEGVGRMQCAVCYSPTTTRCSRCKVVRYCSGKCQIVHWRQGHKEECRPPLIEDNHNGVKSVYDVKGTEQSDLCNSDSEIEGNPPAIPVERPSSESNFSSEIFSDVEPLDTPGTDSTLDSFADSLSSCSSGPVEISHDEDPHPLSTANVEESFSRDGSSYSPRTEIDDNEPSVTKIAGLSVNNLSFTSNSSQEESSCGAEEVSVSGQGITSQPTSMKENSSCKASPTEVPADLDVMDPTDLCFNKSSSVARGRGNCVISLKTKEKGSPSSISSAELSTSSVGGHSVSRDTSSTMSTAAPVLNGISDLKTSVRKVVQQFKPSQILRHYPPALRSDLPGKYKMLFPYDLFIKLYNCDKVELRPCGLTNCGNSCYANSVLQCLSFTRPLSAYLLQGLHSKACLKKEWCFTCELENLLTRAKEGQSPLSPIRIVSHIQNIGSNLGYGKQEDAHEFLRYAIDTMQSACLKEAGAVDLGPFAEETTLIQLIFGGYLLSKIKCMRCRVKSERRERMMDLTVEIHGDIGTLEEALARFTATEILDGENKYQCNRCKSYERAKKKLSIVEAPNILTIALKRFQSGKFGKLNKAIRFPEFLDLAPFMSGTDDKSPVYRLYAVVVHLDVMNAAFSGHYVCYVKSTQKKWYKIDDSKVKPVELERVLSKNAYMLLYARCSPRAPGVVRNTISHELALNKSRSTSMRSRGHSYRPDLHAGFRPSDLFDERFLSRKTDSSSDSSSLLSCSDEGSWSTESTRNSTSTEEFSEYIFGESGCFSGSSSSGFSEDLGREDLDGSLGLSYGDGRPRESRGGGLDFLYSRELTEECRSREADWVNPPYGVQSSVSRRRCNTSERTAQTFYK